MTPRDFALYDTLNCAAIAVDKDGCSRPAEAERAWLEACVSASGLFAPGTAADAAAGVILDAVRPSPDPEGRALLWNALSAASLAVLPAMAGDRESAEILLGDAFAAAGMLPPFPRAAMTVILAEVQAMAEAGVTA